MEGGNYFTVKVLLFGSLLFILASAIHLILWRIALPKRQIKTILTIYFLTLALGTVILFIVPQSITLLGYSAPQKVTDYLHIWIYFTALTLAYMITYTGIEADSPSLVMMSVIADAGPGGVGKDVLDKEMSDDKLVVPRIQDLVLDKMVNHEDNKYCLTRKGRMLARIFIFYRGLLNAPKGG